MAINLLVNGEEYLFPETNDVDWGTDVTDWASAITNSTLQKIGGNVSLLNDLELGTDAGIKSIYFKSNSEDIAEDGVIRLSNTDTINFRNDENDDDIVLGIVDGQLVINNERVGYRTLGELENVSTVVNTATLGQYLYYDGDQWTAAFIGSGENNLTGTVFDTGTPEDVKNSGNSTGYVIKDLGEGIKTYSLFVNASSDEVTSYNKVYFDQDSRSILIQYALDDSTWSDLYEVWNSYNLDIKSLSGGSLVGFEATDIGMLATNVTDAIRELKEGLGSSAQYDVATNQEVIDGITNKIVDAEKLKSNYVQKDSNTGAAILPVGNISERPSEPQQGMFRFNNETNSFEGFAIDSWSGVGGAAGGAGNPVFYENDSVVTQDYTITEGKNAMTAGPITINPNVTVTIPVGSTWTIV